MYIRVRYDLTAQLHLHQFTLVLENKRKKNEMIQKPTPPRSVCVLVAFLRVAMRYV